MKWNTFLDAIASRNVFHFIFKSPSHVTIAMNKDLRLVLRWKLGSTPDHVFLDMAAAVVFTLTRVMEVTFECLHTLISWSVWHSHSKPNSPRILILIVIHAFRDREDSELSEVFVEDAVVVAGESRKQPVTLFWSPVENCLHNLVTPVGNVAA